MNKYISILISILFLATPLVADAERGIAISGPASQARTALVIGNSKYKASPLKNPANDATDMASVLRDSGFDVTLKVNATQREMDDAIRDFGKKLRNGGTGLFYFAGHGVQIAGRNYLIPIGAKIESESDVKYEAVDGGRVLGKMEDAGNDLNIVILDACRNNPFIRSFRSAEMGLARMDAPKGSLIAYATAPGSIAADGGGRNGIYTKHLIRNISQPGLTVEDVLKRVRNAVVDETLSKQIPWESSSLMGNFYFSGSGGKKTHSSSTSSSLQAERDRLAEERARIESERQELEQLKELAEEERQLVAERKRLEEERTKLAMAEKPSPTISGARATARDGSFIAYDNGTVKDTSTGLMWAAKDNGRDINWSNAKSYCENYEGGGYTDWRMPTQDELAGLYDKSITNTTSSTGGCNGGYHLTNLINLTCCCPWASEMRGSAAVYFDFNLGNRYGLFQSNSNYYRALPVRSGK